MLQQLGSSAMSRRDILGLAGFLGVVLVLPSCSSEAANDMLSAADTATVAEIADIIIPATVTPGAKAAGVGEFTKMMVADWFDDAERERFMTGLRTFEADAVRKFGKAFANLSVTQREELIGSALAAVEARPLDKGEKPPFILLMKRLTIVGYYTSEIGASEELELNLVPGSYDGCGHMGRDSRAGSTGFRNASFSAS